MKTDRFVCPACDKHKLGQYIYIWWEGRWGLGSRWVKVCVRCSTQDSLKESLDAHYHDNLDYYRSLESFRSFVLLLCKLHN